MFGEIVQYENELVSLRGIWKNIATIKLNNGRLKAIYISEIEYLKKEAKLTGNNIIKSTHQHIAYDLGSSREVISRLLKKLEHQGLIQLHQGTVEILKHT